MRRPLALFRADERGATSIEYGIIVAIMGLSLVVALAAFPTTLNAIWAEVASHLK